jgi:hypothetical protein
VLPTRCPGAKVVFRVTHRTPGVNAAQIQAAPSEYARRESQGTASPSAAASATTQAPKEHRPNSVHPPSTTAAVLPGRAGSGEIDAPRRRPPGRAGGETDMAPHWIRWDPSRPTLRRKARCTNDCGMSDRCGGTERRSRGMDGGVLLGRRRSGFSATQPRGWF